MRKITVDPCSKVIELGRYGENEATSVYLPLAEFQNYTPGGTFSVLVRRPDLGYPSPVEFTISEGYAVWNVGESFLAVEGYGKLELRYTVNGTRALGRVWNTHVGESIIPQGETAPDPFESWYENILEAGDRAEAAEGGAEHYAETARGYAEDAETAKEAIENMTVSSETLEAGSQATVEKSIVEGVVNLKFGIPKGKDAENVISRDTQTNLNGILRGNGANIDIQAVDSTPTENSNNLVSSDGVAKALKGKYSKPNGGIPKTDLAENVKESLNKADTALQSVPDTYRTAEAQDVIDEAQNRAIQGKQDTLTFDSEPTSGSTNPVTSDGVFNGIVKVLPTATASGSIASFDDGADDIPVKSLVVDVEPVQELHGYNAPWPAGGGKNKCPIATMSTVNGGYINASSGIVGAVVAGTQYTLSFKNNTPSTANIVVRMRVDGAWATLTEDNLVAQGARAYTFTPSNSGDVSLSAYLGTNYAPAFSDIQLEIGSTATDYAPYSNICPISGWTGANVTRTGVNMWDEEWELGNISDQTGENLPQSNVIRSKNYIPVKPNTTYYSTMQGGGIFFYDVNKQFIPFSIYPGFPNAFTTPANCYYIRFRETGVYGTTYNQDISINYPATDTEYHAYSGTTIPITFPSEAGTVYGGTLDVTNGVLTVDRAMVDLGTLSWGKQTTPYNVTRYYSYDVQSSAKEAVDGNTPIANALCSEFLLASANAGFAGVIKDCITIDPQAILSVYPTASYADATSFKSAMNGVQLVYELATPIVYHLTPTEVTTLLAQNNIWADTGDVTVTYRQDIGLAINKLNNAILSLGGNI